MKDHGIVYGTPAIPAKRLGDPWTRVNEWAKRREREQRKPRIQRVAERMISAYQQEKAAFEKVSIMRLMNP